MVEFSKFRVFIILIYIIPSFALYGIFLYIIFFGAKKHNFEGSFYKIFGFSIICYMCDQFFYYISMRTEMNPFFRWFLVAWGEHGFWPTFMIITPYYFNHCVHLFNCLMALNRFTVFALKTKYETFWRRYLKYFILFSFTLPTFLVWHNLFIDECLIVNPGDAKKMELVKSDCNAAAIPWMKNEWNSAILITFTSFLSATMTFYVVYKMIKQRILHSNQQHKVSTQNIRLTIYTILIFIVEIICSVTMYILAFLPFSANDKEPSLELIDQIILFWTIFDYLIDVSTLAPAWFALATNEVLRTETFELLHIKISSKTSVVSMSVSATTPIASNNSRSRTQSLHR